MNSLWSRNAFPSRRFKFVSSRIEDGMSPHQDVVGETITTHNSMAKASAESWLKQMSAGGEAKDEGWSKVGWTVYKISAFVTCAWGCKHGGK